MVSHDRHFLDNVCTHIADIDYSKIKMHSGNYTFWSESSRLAAQQRSQTNKKLAERRKELQEFVARFGANLSKAKQATSRQKLLDKLTIEDIEPPPENTRTSILNKSARRATTFSALTGCLNPWTGR